MRGVVFGQAGHIQILRPVMEALAAVVFDQAGLFHTRAFMYTRARARERERERERERGRGRGRMKERERGR